VKVQRPFLPAGSGCLTYATPLLSISQILIRARGNPKKKSAVRGKELIYCRHFSVNGKWVQMRISELSFKKTRFLPKV